MKSYRYVQTTLDQKNFEGLKILAMRLGLSITTITRNAIVEFLNTKHNQEILNHGKNEQTQ